MPTTSYSIAPHFFRDLAEGLKGTSSYRKAWQGGYIELYGACAGWYGPDGGFTFHRKRNYLDYQKAPKAKAWIPPRNSTRLVPML